MYPPRARTFRAPKALEQLQDCQDFIHPQPGFGEVGNVFAVADGSTSSFYAAKWAEILTEGFFDFSDVAFADWEGWLAPRREDWLMLVRSRLDANSTLAPDIRLIFENNLTEGRDAGATFVGLEFLTPTGDGLFPWRVLAVGDACVFHLRADKVVSLPLDDAEKFDFQTVAISSMEEAPDPQRFMGLTESGDLYRAARPGDIFIMATDAVAKWMLTSAKLDKPVWGEVLALAQEGLAFQKSKQRFDRLIERARIHPSQQLDNDDVALGIMIFGTPHPRYTGVAGGFLEGGPELDEAPAAPVQPVSLRPPMRPSFPSEAETPRDVSSAPTPPPSPRGDRRRSKRRRNRVVTWIATLLLVIAALGSWVLIASLSSKVEALRVEKTDLQAQLEEAAAASRRLEQSPKYQEMLGQMGQLKERNADLQKEKSAFQKDQEKIAARLQEITAERDELKRTVEKLTNEKKDREAQGDLRFRSGVTAVAPVTAPPEQEAARPARAPDEPSDSAAASRPVIRRAPSNQAAESTAEHRNATPHFRKPITPIPVAR